MMRFWGAFLLVLLGFQGLAQDFKYLPEAEGCNVVKHKHYALCYSEKHEQPLWVTYQLTGKETSGRYDRTDNFRRDHKVESESAALEDYSGSGYDRGHLAPAGDMGFSRVAMSESFYLSNMTPQEAGFNRGIWRSLESQVRDWARGHKEVYVVTGGIFNTVKEKVGPNDVSVPGSYYKIVVDLNSPEIRGIAFIMPHRDLEGELEDYAVSIDKVEKRTGIDFFADLKDRKENKIEGQSDYDAWGLGKERNEVSYSGSEKEELKVNVNTASQAKLEQLHGIGPVKAKRIIKGRPYKEPEDLLRVKGIGEVTLDKIKGRLVF